MKSFTNPKILGYAASEKFILAFLKIYGDGLRSSEFA